MRAFIVGILLCTSLTAPAFGWNEKGHMVVARLAWLQLTDAERESVSKTLRAHPHYEEFLIAECPDGMTKEEWAFMRAAFWPDWIRSNHRAEYHKSTWHYVSAGFVPPYSKMNPMDLPTESPNVVTQIPLCIEKVRSGTDQEKAIYLCWLLHLVGDIHQPLHCCSLLSEAFPAGDRGGNLALVRINGGRPVKLHPLWDGLLGKPTSLSSISGAVAEIQRLEQSEAVTIENDVQSHVTPGEWAKEGFELAKACAYLNGDLRPANAENNPNDDEVPNVAEAYAQNAGKIARVVVAKAGRRLTSCLADAMR